MTSFWVRSLVLFKKLCLRSFSSRINDFSCVMSAAKSLVESGVALSWLE